MGGVAWHELAAAVSEAGGLGTIGGVRGPIADEVAAARRLTGRPIAVNLLLPFVGPGDAGAAAQADVVVTFWGLPRRLAATTWIHQCGSVEEAKAAAHAGADALIVQGVEAGGHVRAKRPLLELLERVRAAVQLPLLGAGVDADDVRAVLDAGAVARWWGRDSCSAMRAARTRSTSCAAFRRARPCSPSCSGSAGRTRRTESSRTRPRGAGWGADRREPRWIRAANRVGAPLVRRIPPALQERASATQRPSQPSLGPQPPTVGGPDNLVDSGPLYAGANIGRIADVPPAAELVRVLAP
jgi:nitronate monooxygenase